MEPSEHISFRHPSSVSLFNLYDRLNFPSVKDKTILKLIEERSSFFEWALKSSNLFCFDDFTYEYIKEQNFTLSNLAHIKQCEKREKYRNDTIEYNSKYDKNKEIIIEECGIKLFKLEYKLGFGQFADKTIDEMIDQCPSRIEFYVQELPWFGLTIPAINKLKSLEPTFIFLESTYHKLDVKYDLAPDFMKISRVGGFNENDYDNDYSVSEPYSEGDPRYDSNENPWLDVFGEGDEAEDAYWNTD